MEKTLTINISGWVFNINEDAFEKLTQYFKNLKQYFKKQQDGEEIVNDIESRIAELFKEKMTETDRVITIADVEHIMKIMGRPDEMEEESEETVYEESSDSHRFHKKLFRDPLNAHVGGVASGLGKWLNLDPIILRIAFIILVMPGGLGVILYAVLWILIPEAASTSDRIRMEGKKVNIKNIEDKVREEAGFIKDRLSDFSDEAMDVFHKTGPARRQGLLSLERFFQSLGKIIIRVLKILLGIIFLSLGIGFLIPFVLAYFNLVPEMGMHFNSFFVNEISLPVFLDTYIFDTKYTIITLISLTILILIPIVMLVFNGIRFIFNLKRNKLVGSIAWQAWVVALIISLGMSYTTIRAYKNDALTITNHDFDQVSSDTLQIRLNTNSYYQNILSADQKTVISQDYNFPILHEGEFYGIPELKFESYDKDHFIMKMYLSANGKSSEDAHENIQDVSYYFHIDSAGIVLDPYFKLDENQRWRNQDVQIKIFVPEGKYLAIDRNIHKHFRLQNFLKYKIRNNQDFWNYFVAIDEDIVSSQDFEKKEAEKLKDKESTKDQEQGTEKSSEEAPKVETE